MNEFIELFDKSKRASFEDGASKLIVVIGSGLHHHLSEHGVGNTGKGDESHLLRDWNGLLRNVLKPKTTAASLALYHDDPTATWESLLAYRAKNTRSQMQANKHEAHLRKRVSTLIQEATLPGESLFQFGNALNEAGFRDIISLNFDRTLDRAAYAFDSSVEPTIEGARSRGRSSAASRLSLHVRHGRMRIWHPHGLVGRKQLSDTIQLGAVAYCKAVAEVNEEVRSYRAERSSWRNKRGRTKRVGWDGGEATAWSNYVRDLNAKSSSWIRQLLCSDVAFVGCGLNRAELDIWLLLHERQRQFLRLPKTARPKTFFLHPVENFPPHLITGPAGVLPIVTRSHDQAWELLLGRWWDRRRLQVSSRTRV